MYRLTARMQQHFRHQLEQFHQLFSAERCSGWQLEEMLFRAIQSDNNAQHHAFWREGGHDDLADIRVRINGDTHLLQIKSGSVKGGYLTLSGHRLGRFNGDFRQITAYLNRNSAEIISVPHRKEDNEHGVQHIYRIAYVAVEHLTHLQPGEWKERGKTWEQTNRYGVIFSLRPSMSWQIWWRIPETLVEQLPEMVI